MNYLIESNQKIILKTNEWIIIIFFYFFTDYKMESHDDDVVNLKSIQ